MYEIDDINESSDDFVVSTGGYVDVSTESNRPIAHHVSLNGGGAL
jgi:hypothetical protein